MTEGAPSQAWLALLVVLSLALGVAYAVVTPLWQAPDEPGHFEQAALLAQHGGPLRRRVQDPALEQAILESLARHRFWDLVRAPRPDPLPSHLADDPFLARSGRQVGDEPLAYYLPLAVLLRLAPGVDAQARLARVYSLVLFGLMVAVAWAAAQELFPDDPFLAPAATAFVGLLPMAAYMGMAINNDVAAALVGTLYAWALVRMGREGPSPACLVALTCTALAGLWVKKTAAFLLPLTAAVFLWTAWRRRRVRPGARRCCRAFAWVAAGVGAAVVALCLLARAPGPEPSAWLDGTLPGRQGRVRAAALEGRYGFQAVDDSPTQAERLVQEIPAAPLQGKEVTLSAVARSPQGSEVGRLALVPDQGEACRQVFQVGELWREVSVRCPVPPEAQALKVVLAAGPGEDPAERGRVYVDAVRLRADGVANLLRNGGAEQAATLGESFAARWDRGTRALRLWLGQGTVRKVQRWAEWLAAVPRVLLEGQVAWGRLALYAVLTFAGFWGNFGWLTVPLSSGWYVLLSLATLGSAAGLVRWWVQGKGQPWQRQTCAWLALALAFAVFQNLVPMLVRDWQPQGRYLLPALFPAGVLFATGWRAWLPDTWARRGAVVFVASFAALNLACLAGYVIPYFHN